MFNLDKIQQKKTNILAAMSKAIKDQDDAAIQQSMNDWTDYVADSVISQAEQSAHIVDSAILAARGIRQLTSQEREYYTKLGEASKANDPKMAVNGITEAFPLTTFDTVLDDVKKTHRLLELIDMKSSSAAIKFVKNKTGKQTGVWGELTSAIAGEVNAEVEVVDATLFKLTAFMYVPKDLFDYGPEWVDKFVRDVLAEVIAVSSETAVVDGDGNKKPIGMTRNISDEASVVGGVYPKKNAIPVTSLDPVAYGKLLAMLARDGGGQPRKVERVILVVNPFDYFEKIMPATTVRSTDGRYVNNILPFPTEIVQSVALESGEAVLGLAGEYCYCIGAGKNGKLTYDDSYKFLEDFRTYAMKMTAYGKANDNNAFQRLDISALEPANFTVKIVNTEEDPANMRMIAAGSTSEAATAGE